MSDLAARIRAARAYAGLTQPALARHLEQDAQTVKRTEAGRRQPKEPELLAIAKACGLPYEFFTIDFGELPYYAGLEKVRRENPSAGEALVVDYGRLTERLAAIEEELGLRDAARSSNQALVEAVDRAAESGHPAVARTRGASDASEGSDEAPPQGKRSSEGPPAG